MAEVYEISRTAFEQLCKNANDGFMVNGGVDLKRQYFVIEGRLSYPDACGCMPLVVVYGSRRTLGDAVWSADYNNRIEHSIQLLGESLHCAGEYEVWHVVEDSTLYEVELVRDSSYIDEGNNRVPYDECLAKVPCGSRSSADELARLLMGPGHSLWCDGCYLLAGGVPVACYWLERDGKVKCLRWA